MGSVEFFADLVLGQAILGVGVGADPQAIESAMGSDFIDDVDAVSGSLRRDYGLIEFFFLPPTPWRCHWFTVQAHRVASTGLEAIPAAIQEAFGPFETRTSGEAVIEALASKGLAVKERVPGPGGGYEDVHFQDSTSVVTLTTEAWGDLKPGDVWQVLVRNGMP